MSKRKKAREWRKVLEWMEKARAADTCCTYQCPGKNFPYCAEHDAP